MTLSILSKLFATDRQRGRAGSGGGFATPLMHERTVREEEAPFLVTGTRIPLIGVKRRPPGVILTGFSEVPLEGEAVRLAELFLPYWAISLRNGWGNRHATVESALEGMRRIGLVPKVIISPAHSGPLDLLHVRAPLGPTQAMVFAQPEMVGSYVRTRDHIALTFHCADRSVFLVDAETEHGLVGHPGTESARTPPRE